MLIYAPMSDYINFGTHHNSNADSVLRGLSIFQRRTLKKVALLQACATNHRTSCQHISVDALIYEVVRSVGCQEKQGRQRLVQGEASEAAD